MTATFQKLFVGIGAIAMSAALAGCGGEFVRDSRAPVRLVVNSITANEQNTLLSDVIRKVRTPAPCSDASPCPTITNDMAVAQFALVLRDPGTGEPATPTPLNQVTITRYRVQYRRADGHNVPGVDVPYDFDSAFTLTVPPNATAEAAFQIVRHSAKEEAPLAALQHSGGIISTIAQVTFYGRDQAGNEISASGSIGIDFGDFADSND